MGKQVWPSRRLYDSYSGYYVDDPERVFLSDAFAAAMRGYYFPCTEFEFEVREAFTLYKNGGFSAMLIILNRDFNVSYQGIGACDPWEKLSKLHDPKTGEVVVAALNLRKSLESQWPMKTAIYHAHELRDQPINTLPHGEFKAPQLPGEIVPPYIRGLVVNG